MMRFDSEYISVYLYNKLLSYYEGEPYMIKQTVGYKITNSLDTYYIKRYKQILYVINMIYDDGIRSLRKQNKLLSRLNFPFTS